MITAFLDRSIQWVLMFVAAAILVADLNHIIEYIFIALAIIVLLRQVIDPSRSLVHTSLDLPILFFLSWVFISIMDASDPSYSLSEWRKLIAHVLMFFLIVNFLSEERQAQQILAAFLGGMLLMSIYGVFEFFIAEASFFDQWNQRVIRADSLTSTYNWFSTYLIMGIPIATVWLLSVKHYLWRSMLWFTLIAALVALILTYTRAAWVAVLLQGCLLLTFKVSKAYRILILFGSTVFLSGFLFLSMNNIAVIDKSELSGIEHTSNTMNLHTLKCRLNIWQSGIEDIMKSPVTGYGYGTKTFAKKYHATLIDECPAQLHNIHSSYLSVAFGSGIPAACFFVWIFLCILYGTWRGGAKKQSEFQQMLSLGVFLMTIGMMVRIAFDVMFLGMLAVLFWMLVGLIFGLQYGAASSTNKFSHQR